jgi:hypothetical protein
MADTGLCAIGRVVARALRTKLFVLFVASYGPNSHESRTVYCVA